MNSYSESAPTLCARCRGQYGFTLIELMITVVIVGIITAVAYPSYTQYAVRASRQAAQGELVQLASVQEKIYLNSSAYAVSVTAAYNGKSDGGLGKTSGLTDDRKYAITVSPSDTPGQAFTLTATPVAGKTQVNDYIIALSSTGAKTLTPTGTNAGSATTW